MRPRSLPATPSPSRTAQSASRRSAASPRSRRWAALLALLCAACQPAGEAPDGVRVVRLEPVQWSAGVPSARLASEVAFRDHLDPVGEGRFENVVEVAPGFGEFAPAVRPDPENHREFAGWIAEGLAWPPHLDWDLWIEVQGRPRHPLHLLMEPPGVSGTPRRYAAKGHVERTWSDDSGRERSKVVFRAQADPDLWRSGVGSLAVRFEPKSAGVRLLNIVAEGRPLRLETQAEGDDEGPRDLGLWTRAVESDDPAEVRYESRRSFPGYPGQPLVAEYVAGGRPRLHVGCALPPLRSNLGAVTFEVRARRAANDDPAGAGRRLARMTLDGKGGSRTWEPLAVDLPGAEGERWQVILDLRWEGPEDVPAGLWGAPTIDYRKGERRPSALVITADTLRADHFAAYREVHGLGDKTGLETPHLDDLAERGVLFADALSASNATGPSHVSLFTSLPLRDHQVLKNAVVLPAGHQTLAELFADGGWSTLHLSAARHLNPELSGLGQGVDQYLEMPEVRLAAPSLDTSGAREKLHPDAQRGLYHSSAEYGAPRFLEAVDELGERPFYAWLHTFDPHTPYLPPSSILDELGLEDDGEGRPVVEVFADRHKQHPGDVGYLVRETPLVFLGDIRSVAYAKALYAASVTHMDRSLGELFDGLERRGRLADTLIVFTSDHGESLGERDSWFDHRGAYGATLRVPLVMSGAGVAAGHVVTAGVSTLDVLPTLADWFGLEAPDYVAGRSLAATLRDPVGAPPAPQRRWFEHARRTQVGFTEGDEWFVLTVTDQASSSFGDRRFRGDTELLRSTKRLDDPEPLLGDDPEILADRVAEVRAWMLDRQVEIEAEEAGVSAEEQAVLEALGYKD
jgi:arylsulfatase A-like enzyme